MLTITSRGGTRLQTTITSVWRAQVGGGSEGKELCGGHEQAASSRLHQALVMLAFLAGCTSSAPIQSQELPIQFPGSSAVA